MNNNYLEKLIDDFFERIEVKNIDLDNEDNLQRLISYYIEDNLPSGYEVITEKNIKDICTTINKERGEKSEIDVCIINKNNDEKYAIELKYLKKAKNGGVNKYMEEYLKDIHFMERLKKDGGFSNTYALVVTNDSSYYTDSGRNNVGLYDYFRNNTTIKKIQLLKLKEKVKL